MLQYGHCPTKFIEKFCQVWSLPILAGQFDGLNQSVTLLYCTVYCQDSKKANKIFQPNLGSGPT